jgi:hypothetical protein
VLPDQALRNLRETVALWNVDYVRSTDVVDAACDLLVAGLDSPSLRILAGVPRRNADIEVPQIVEPALREIGLEYHCRGSREAEEAAVRALAMRVLSGSVEPSALTVWAHRRFGHDGLDLAQRLVELDDVYDAYEYDDGDQSTVDDDVIAEARRLVSGETTGSTGD